MNRDSFDPSRVQAPAPGGDPGRVDGTAEKLANEVIGAAIEVHRALGPGFPESVYEEALCIELEERGIEFVRQAPISVFYRGRRVGEGRVDLLIDQCLVVELKAVDSLAPEHTAQVVSYLRASNQRLGLLLNFNARKLREGVKRVIL